MQTSRLARRLQLFEGVVRNANVRRLELAWAASNLASRASAVAVAVYAYEADGVGAVGVIVFLRLAVAAGASPWLSVLADRRSRRAVLVGSDLLRSVLLGAMAVLVTLEAPSYAVYVLAVVVAVAEPVFRSAQAAFTPSLVSTPEELTAANVLASGLESVGLFAGPAFGALLLVLAGTDIVFAVTAGVLLLSIAFVMRIGIPGEPVPETAGSSHTLLAGWHAIVSEPGLRAVIGLFSVQTLVAGMTQVLVVVMAIELLSLGTAGVGWLNGAIGAGATIGVLAVAGVAGRRRLSPFFTLGLLLWAIPLLAVAAWPQPAVALVLLALVGVGNTLVDVTGITLMQRSASDAVLGRVFGAFEALALMAMGIGSLLAPLLVEALDARGAIVVAGLLVPVALAAFWRPLAAVDTAPVAAEELELLEAIPIFAPLRPPQLERAASVLAGVPVDAGEPVFREGEPGDRFYVVADGELEVETAGKRVRTLGRGDFFGEIALLWDVPRTATVRALTPSRLYALDSRSFVEIVTGHPASSEAALRVVASRLPSPVAN
jgi:predicted MFS family arabinose efflux permease